MPCMQLGARIFSPGDGCRRPSRGSSWAHFRWLRKSFSVSNATLTLYEYHAFALGPPLKLQSCGAFHGDFDFGSILKGHYSLVVEVKNTNQMGRSLDVEVTDTVKSTRVITVDVSPIMPDCTGGHELIETKS